MQLELGLDWTKHPWNGLSPRYLRNVEKSRTFAKPATVTPVLREYVDPAQMTLFLEGKSYGS